MFDDLMYYIVSVLFLLLVCWCTCMAINISVWYNDGLPLDIILLISTTINCHSPNIKRRVKFKHVPNTCR